MTVSKFLKLLNNLGKQLQTGVTQQANKAIAAVNRLRKSVQIPAKLNINTAPFRRQLAKAYLLAHLMKINVSFALQANQAVQRAKALRIQLQNQLNGIIVRVQMRISSAMNALLTGINSTVRQISAAAKQLITNGFKGFGEKATTAASGINSVAGHLKGGMAVADKYVNTRATIGLMNDGKQTTDELQQKIFASAQRSRTDFAGTTAVISKLGNLAGGTFSSNDELIGFTELLQKSFRLGGSSEQEQQAGIQQLAHAIGSGKTEGYFDFRDLLKNAPLVVDAISKYTGISGEKLRDQAEGASISAEVIKEAMFAAADDINGKFNTLPRTFADMGTMFNNIAMQTVGPAIEQLSQLMNEAFESGKLNEVIAVLSSGLNLIASAAVWVGELIFDNMDVVKNILVAVGLVALWVGTQMFISWLMAVWPVLLIIAVITILIALFNYFGVSTGEIIGYVAGIFMMLVAHVWNSIAKIWNVIVSFAEFLINIFIDPIYAIKKLFYDMAMNFGGVLYNMLVSVESFAGGFMSAILKGINGALKGLNWLSSKLKDLTGIDLGQAELLDENNVHAISDKVKEFMDQLEEPVSSKGVVDFGGAKMDQLNYKDMFDKGFNAGSGGFDSASKALGGVTDFQNFGGKKVPFETPPGLPSNIDRVGEVGSIENTVDISSEDLKMMRELAEMKNIQNFVTLQPSINFGDTHVRNESDLNTIVARISEKLEQDIAASADAAYG